jgi:hypothetical protein
MTLDEVYNKYGEPFYIGSKHMLWKTEDLQRVIKATKPGYLSDGSIIITSQPWHEPADPTSPHPSESEMDECLQRFGFTKINSFDWKRTDGIMARNVRPGDFIKTKDGIVPVDVNVENPAPCN